MQLEYGPYRVIAWCALAAGATSLVLALIPAIDIAVSGAFHNPQQGFSAARADLPRAFRRMAMAATLAASLTAVVALLWPLAFRQARFFLGMREGLFVALAFAMGPWLVVNQGMKNSFDRARPRSIDLFGGDLPFSPAWMIADACQVNCSFPSGEAAAGAALVAVLLLATGGRRPWLVGGVFAFVVAASVNRIAFGGHFLSDVLVAWAVAGLAAAAAHWVVYRSGVVPAEADLVEIGRRAADGAANVAWRLLRRLSAARARWCRSERRPRLRYRLLRSRRPRTAGTVIQTSSQCHLHVSRGP